MTFTKQRLPPSSRDIRDALFQSPMNQLSNRILQTPVLTPRRLMMLGIKIESDRRSEICNSKQQSDPHTFLVLVHRIVTRRLARVELLLQLIYHKAFVVLETLLYVHLELDSIVQHARDLGVELFTEGIGPDCELLVPDGR